MENIIIKFKSDLKKFQTTRKKILKECEKELMILKKLITGDMSIFKEINIFNISEDLNMATTVAAVNLSLENNKTDNKNINDKMIFLYETLLNFTTKVKQEYNDTQNIINAFDNEKIKAPINSIELLFNQMPFTTLNIEEIEKIIIITIIFNNKYAKKNKNHKIENIEVINELIDKYINENGTYKYNTNIDLYKQIINTLIKNIPEELKQAQDLISTSKTFTTEDLIKLRIKNTKEKFQTKKTNNTEIKKEKNISFKKNIGKALQELKKYYKNGTIIAIPENLEKFYLLLEETNLDTQEKNYIINLINKKISNKQINTLSQKEENIYLTAKELSKKLDYSNGDSYIIKKLIEEIKTIIELFEIEENKSNKEYLQDELNTTITKLEKICNKYLPQNKKINEEILFLTDENKIPYIKKDIIDINHNTYKLLISLEPKRDLTKTNTNEKTPYNIFETVYSKYHITFIEISSSTYILIGAYSKNKELKKIINRIIENKQKIELLETIVKFPEAKTQLLKEHRKYFQTLSNSKYIKENKILKRRRIYGNL